MSEYDSTNPAPGAPATGPSKIEKFSKGLAGLAGLYGSIHSIFNPQSAQKIGYLGGIPSYTASRQQVPNAFNTQTAGGGQRRPGSGGRRYFTDTTYTPKAGGSSYQPSMEEIMALNDQIKELVASRSTANKPTTPAPGGGSPAPTMPTLTKGPLSGDVVATGSPGNDVLSRADVLANAKKYMTNPDTWNTGQAIDSGEAANLLAGAKKFGISPKDMAEAMGVSEAQVLNRLAQDYPSMKDDYLKEHGYNYARGGLASLRRAPPERFRERGRRSTSSQTPVAALPGVMEMLRARSPSPSGGGFNKPMPASSMGMADDLQHLQVSPQEMEYKKQVMQSGAYPFSSTGKLGTASSTGMPDASIASNWASGSVMGPATPPPPGMRVPNAQGGMGMFAQGGIASLQPRYLRGATDGMADEIPSSIDGKEPAALSHGEFVVPADVISHLGNGNSDAGAKVLYDMMDRIRKARTGTTEQGRRIDPNKLLPA